jgi:Carboxypeptidase regulatory-like domain
MFQMKNLFPTKGLWLIAKTGSILLLLNFVCIALVRAQDAVTGSFEGRVTNAETGAPLPEATVQFINQATGIPIAKHTDSDGRFYQGLLFPGTYIIRASAPGFKTMELERRLLATQNNRVFPPVLALEPIKIDVNVNRVDLNASAQVPLNKRPSSDELATVNFTTNVTRGEIQFINTTTGEPPRIVPIQNGHGLLNNLRPGSYNVDIRSGEVGYKTLYATFTLPGATDFDVKLAKLSSTQTFAGKWEALNLWDTPNNWRAVPSKLIVNERGIGIPRDESYRYYSDFNLTCDIKMINGVAASFVIHAIDIHNYYLIQITGPNADEPYVMRSFVVKEGVSQRLKKISIGEYATTLQPSKFFEVSIKMKDNNIHVSVTDSETGALLPLGTLNDPNRTFSVGAVGIAARDNEQNEIGRFIVSLY